MRITHPAYWDYCLLRERSEHLPESSGLYAVLNSENHIFYIGQSVNLRRRWLGNAHHRCEQAFIEVDRPYLAWVLCPESKLDFAESALIERYEPDWNDTPVPEYDFTPVHSPVFDHGFNVGGIALFIVSLIAAIILWAISESQGNKVAPTYLTVNSPSGAANVRAGPSTDYPVLLEALNGTQLVFSEQQESGWMKTKSGWIYGSLVD